ncbi:hypothetical protein KW800_01995 [Candidatus Parcubacteria bacterium]|nr:hypothetical protein [Candidatus Parcubacteria bacterium]
MKRLLIIASLFSFISPTLSLQAASLVDLGYGSSSQTGLIEEASSTVDYENDSVIIYHEDETRLMSLVPVALLVKITAYHDGRVEFDYPWYGLFAPDKDALESKVRTAAAEVLEMVPTGGWTDDDRGSLAEHIKAALQEL